MSASSSQHSPLELPFKHAAQLLKRLSSRESTRLEADKLAGNIWRRAPCNPHLVRPSASESGFGRPRTAYCQRSPHAARSSLANCSRTLNAAALAGRAWPSRGGGEPGRRAAARQSRPRAHPHARAERAASFTQRRRAQAARERATPDCCQSCLDHCRPRSSSTCAPTCSSRAACRSARGSHRAFRRSRRSLSSIRHTARRRMRRTPTYYSCSPASCLRASPGGIVLRRLRLPSSRPPLRSMLTAVGMVLLQPHHPFTLGRRGCRAQGLARAATNLRSAAATLATVDALCSTIAALLVCACARGAARNGAKGEPCMVDSARLHLSYREGHSWRSGGAAAACGGDCGADFSN